MFVDLAFVLPWVAVLALILPTITAWMLARRQAQGAGAVGKAIEGLAVGASPRRSGCPPTRWATLAFALNSVLGKLRQIPETLASSASRLVAAGKELSEANNEQQQSLNQQAAAIQETQVTSQEIKHTSQMTSERAESMLRVAKRAEELGHEGEAAIEQSMQGLSAIQRLRGRHAGEAQPPGRERHADRRDHRGREGHGGPVQPAGGERRHRGGPRWRQRQGLRGAGPGDPRAGGPVGQEHHAHPHHPRRGHRRHPGRGARWWSRARATSRAVWSR